MKEKLFNRNFTLLILGQVSSLIGNYTLRFALSMYVLEQTGSASVFAGLLSLALLPTILLSPFGGVLADRVNRRNIMAALDALSGTAVLLAGFAMTFGRDIFVIGVLLVILSVLGAFESPTVQACVPQMLSDGNIVKGNAVVSQTASAASLITPFTGSLFYTAFGLRAVFGGAVICFFVTAFLECFIQVDHKKAGSGMSLKRMLRKDFSAGFYFIRRERPEILKLLLLAALVSLFVAGTAVVGFPYLVRSVLGLSARYYGAAESVMGIGAILGSLCAAAWAGKFPACRLYGVFILFGICLIPCGIVFLIPSGTVACYLVLLAMFCVCQMGCSFFSTYAVTIIQRRTPRELMGKVMSYVFTLSMCAQPVGQIFFGALFDRFSDKAYWVLLPSGFIVCGIGILSSGFFRKLEGREAGFEK